MDRTLEKEMMDVFGFVPDFYRTVPEAGQRHAWGLQRDVELPETALEPKVKELIGLALAAHLKCRYCTYFHTRAAQAHGATDEELREAVLMGGFTSMMSNALNGADYDLGRFRQEVDRAIQHMTGGAQPSAH